MDAVPPSAPRYTQFSVMDTKAGSVKAHNTILVSSDSDDTAEEAEALTPASRKRQLDAILDEVTAIGAAEAEQRKKSRERTQELLALADTVSTPPTRNPLDIPTEVGCSLTTQRA